MTHTPFHILKGISLLLLISVSAAIANEPSPLPPQGAGTEHLLQEHIRLEQNDATLRISGLCPEDYRPLHRVEAEIRTGDTATPVPQEQWKWENATTHVDWVILLDVSDTMRTPVSGKVFLREAIDATQQLLLTKEAGDTLQVMTTAEALIEVGRADDEGSAASLKAALQQRRNTATRRHGAGNARTSYLQHIEELVTHTLNTPVQGRSTCIILFSDGEDDGSANDSTLFPDLVAAANRKSIHIHSVGFKRNVLGSGLNTLKRMADKTHGRMILCTGGTPDAAAIEQIVASEHKPAGSVVLHLPQGEYEVLHLNCFRQAEEQPCAKLMLQRSVLQSVALPQQTEEEEQHTETQADAAALLLEIHPRIMATLQTIKEQSQDNLPAERQEALQATLQEQVAALLPLLRSLKVCPFADAEQAVQAAIASENTVAEMRRALENVLQICRNEQIETIEEEHVLWALREALSEERAEPTEQPHSVPPKPDTKLMVTAGALILLFVLTAAFMGVMMRRSKRRRQAELAELAKQAEEAMEEQQNVASEADEHTPTEMVGEPGGPEPVAEQAPLAYLRDMQNNSLWSVDQAIIRIGRAADNDISYPDEASVSSYHCTMKMQRNGEWIISDIGSSNGVYINNKAIQQAVLRDGDIIELGRLHLRFHTQH